MKKLIDYQYLPDSDLIKNVKCDNCNDSMKELDNRHSGICYSMLKKYYQCMSFAGVDPAEIAKEKSFVMYKSALNFDSTKNVKFSTWLANQMRFHCLNSMNKSNNLISMENDLIKNFIEKKQADTINNDLADKEKIEFIFNLLKQFKESRAQEIFKLRYFSDKKNMSWSKIGKILNISTQTVINIHNKCIIFLKNKLESTALQDII
jgi:RNA polymerase sigma factor (sigma-70 family)